MSMTTSRTRGKGAELTVGFQKVPSLLASSCCGYCNGKSQNLIFFEKNSFFFFFGGGLGRKKGETKIFSFCFRGAGGEPGGDEEGAGACTVL